VSKLRVHLPLQVSYRSGASSKLHTYLVEHQLSWLLRNAADLNSLMHTVLTFLFYVKLRDVDLDLAGENIPYIFRIHVLENCLQPAENLEA